MILKKCHLIRKEITEFKNIRPQTKNTKGLKVKNSDNAGDLFSEL